MLLFHLSRIIFIYSVISILISFFLVNLFLNQFVILLSLSFIIYFNNLFVYLKLQILFAFSSRFCAVKKNWMLICCVKNGVKNQKKNASKSILWKLLDVFSMFKRLQKNVGLVQKWRKSVNFMLFIHKL